MGTKTLLDAVNGIFKRTGIIAGDAADLTTLTDSARQREINVAVQVVNEGNISLYRAATGLPNELAESTITLAASDRSYALQSDLVQLHFPMIDKTNSQFIFEFGGGYEGLLQIDPEQDDTGLPLFAAISPVNGELYLDRAPTSVEAGRVYTYQYEKDIQVAATTDTFPYTDAAFTMMVPAWVQLWKRELRNEFDGELFREALGTAGELLPRKQRSHTWFPR